MPSTRTAWSAAKGVLWPSWWWHLMGWGHLTSRVWREGFWEQRFMKGEG